MKKSLFAVTCLLVGACGSPAKPVVAPAPTPDPVVEPTPVAESAPAPAPTPAPRSLFERLGGLPAIEAVVHEFVTRTTTDPRIKQRFFAVDATNLEKLLSEFVCLATGGPCKYTGRDMPSSHAGMELVDEEFTALVENLVGALDKFKVPEAEKGELLGALGPLKPQIVVAAGALKPIDAAKLDKVTKLAATVKNPEAVELLGLAVVAGQRGQRSYAEQLFARAELAAGAKPLASVASTFREGAPPVVATPLKKAKDTGPQAKSVGSSDTDFVDKKPVVASLTGTLQLDGKAMTGIGLVTLTPASGKFAKRTPKQRVIEQRDKTFAPHVMAVPPGSTVAFPNFDKLYHNVFSLSKSKAFDLGLFKNGDQREMKFDKPGIVRVGCNIHSSMSAYLIVVEAPNYVVVEDGTFKFRSLPPGKYKVEAWSERSGDPVVSELEIKAGANAATLDLKGAKVTASPDKFGNARDK